ncbi:hypothetical protein, partial [Salmonella enterica]|uniref:hypothetical protein n=1 Tax=Salmonella enterica TaxID=28901 RepID=UPI00262F647D
MAKEIGGGKRLWIFRDLCPAYIRPLFCRGIAEPLTIGKQYSSDGERDRGWKTTLDFPGFVPS